MTAKKTSISSIVVAFFVGGAELQKNAGIENWISTGLEKQRKNKQNTRTGGRPAAEPPRARARAGAAHPVRGGAPLKGWRTPEGVAHALRGGAPPEGRRSP